MPDDDFSQFLIALLNGERVLVPNLAEIGESELAEATRTLTEFERRYRTALPSTAPVFAVEVAVWGAQKFYRACQCLVFRDVSVQAIEAELDPICPIPAAPASLAYSVDLTWRFLPDLLRLTGGIAADDPLVTWLRHWAAAWPLSSVGITAVGDVEVSGLMGDDCLRLVYVDRIISRRDVSRLNDSRVRDAVREAIGAFPELAPEMVEGCKA
ncbi:MAG: hypothetical protein ACKV2Q_34785 [Planctomycetaceae bacterium]